MGSVHGDGLGSEKSVLDAGGNGRLEVELLAHTLHAHKRGGRRAVASRHDGGRCDHVVLRLPGGLQRSGGREGHLCLCFVVDIDIGNVGDVVLSRSSKTPIVNSGTSGGCAHLALGQVVKRVQRVKRVVVAEIVAGHVV